MPLDSCTREPLSCRARIGDQHARRKVTHDWLWRIVKRAWNLGGQYAGAHVRGMPLERRLGDVILTLMIGLAEGSSKVIGTNLLHANKRGQSAVSVSISARREP